MERYSSESSSDSEGTISLLTLDFSYRRLTNTKLDDEISELKHSGDSKKKKPESILSLLLSNNQLSQIPSNLALFHNLRYLDISNNNITHLPEFLTKFPLSTLIAKNNQLTNEQLPKSFLSWSQSLKVVNFGGNRLRYFPMQLLELINLKYLYLGSNEIDEIPRSINKIVGLALLSLGGNRLSEVPETLGCLKELEVLVISDNSLEYIPSSIARLKKLKTLQLHKNKLKTLPTEIIGLKYLSELSLRDNPLVVKFVNDMSYDPASLLEISARAVKVNYLQYSPLDLPRQLIEYLDSAHMCVNPRCKGVYFDSRVEHVKFVDFCGKYRVPLMQYLCSSRCIDDASACCTKNVDRMRKVLLG